MFLQLYRLTSDMQKYLNNFHSFTIVCYRPGLATTIQFTCRQPDWTVLTNWPYSQYTLDSDSAPSADLFRWGFEAQMGILLHPSQHSATFCKLHYRFLLSNEWVVTFGFLPQLSVYITTASFDTVAHDSVDSTLRPAHKITGWYLLRVFCKTLAKVLVLSTPGSVTLSKQESKYGTNDKFWNNAHLGFFP